MRFYYSKNKFGAKKTAYNGFIFDSKKEASYAEMLDKLKYASKDSQRVVSYAMQVPYEVIVEGKKICKYILDFKVTYADGRIEHVDTKGYKKGSSYQVFRIKKKLVEALFNIEILVE